MQIGTGRAEHLAAVEALGDGKRRGGGGAT